MIHKINEAFKTTDYDAESALYLLESLGMVPPLWIPEDSGYLYSDEPSGEPNGFKIGVYKWEPEDEEK
jgi:hypothetical protein